MWQKGDTGSDQGSQLVPTMGPVPPIAPVAPPTHPAAAPSRWSGIIRDYILEGQWETVSLIECSVVYNQQGAQWEKQVPVRSNEGNSLLLSSKDKCLQKLGMF